MATDPMNNPDLTLGVEFFVKAVENARKSAEAGRPIFDDKEYVRIRFPADNKRELVAPAHEVHYVSHARRQMTYAERFAPVYQKFKDDGSHFVQGTPLSEAPFLTESRRSELRALNVQTVEQLANLPEPARKRLGMGSMDLVEKAKAYLATASDSAEVVALRRELDELRALMAGQNAVEAAPAADPYDGFEDEDLKNMIRDAGGTVPSGRAGRATLVKALEDIRAAKEHEAA